MSDAFICDAIRTPIGRYGGALASIRADDLAALPIRALMQRNPGVDWTAVDDVYFGCANQAGEDNRNVARMAALLAGLAPAVPGVTVNRLCGSGLEAVGQAARALRLGEQQLVIAGGVESMSRAPFVLGKPDAAFARNQELHDTTLGWRFINPLMHTRYGVDSMPETAENVSEQFNIARADQDLFALRSQHRAGTAIERGYFREEIEPILLQGRKGEQIRIDSDEHPRPQTTLDALTKLPTPFRPGGTVTAGNASGLNDGACALLLASATAVAQHGLKPRARVIAMAATGLEPRIMGYGPVAAVRKVLALSGLSLEAMDTIELNEAFAAQALAVLRELGLPDDSPHVNPNGGAIALGHPLGMSGARIVATALHQLERNEGRYGLCTMCIGVGQGIALVIERINT